jgi:hypothetical protein
MFGEWQKPYQVRNMAEEMARCNAELSLSRCTALFAPEYGVQANFAVIFLIHASTTAINGLFVLFGTVFG